MIESNVLVEVSRWSISLVKPLQQNTKTQHLSREQARWVREKESQGILLFFKPNEIHFTFAKNQGRVDGHSVQHNSHYIKNISIGTAHVLSHCYVENSILDQIVFL